MCAAGRPTAIAAGIEDIPILHKVHHLAEGRTDKKGVVGLIEVDHSKTVNTWVARFFFDHGINDLTPATEAVTMINSIGGE